MINADLLRALNTLESRIEKLEEQNKSQAKQINFLFERQQSIVEVIKNDR